MAPKEAVSWAMNILVFIGIKDDVGGDAMPTRSARAVLLWLPVRQTETDRFCRF